MPTSTKTSALETALYDLILSLSYSFADMRFVGRVNTIWLDQPEAKGLLAFIEGYKAPRYLNYNRTHYSALSFDSLLIYRLTHRFKYLSLISEALYTYDEKKVLSAIRKNIEHIACTDESLEKLDVRSLFPELGSLTLERMFPDTNVVSIDDFPKIKPLIFDRFYLEALEYAVTTEQKALLQVDINIFADCLKAMDMGFKVINSLTVQSGGRANKKDSNALEIVSDRYMEFIRIHHYREHSEFGPYFSYITMDFNQTRTVEPHYLTAAINESSKSSNFLKRRSTEDHPLLNISEIAFQGFINRYCSNEIPISSAALKYQ